MVIRGFLENLNIPPLISQVLVTERKARDIQTQLILFLQNIPRRCWRSFPLRHSPCSRTISYLVTRTVMKWSLCNPVAECPGSWWREWDHTHDKVYDFNVSAVVAQCGWRIYADHKLKIRGICMRYPLITVGITNWPWRRVEATTKLLFSPP
jgi:hypothetical protein